MLIYGIQNSQYYFFLDLLRLALIYKYIYIIMYNLNNDWLHRPASSNITVYDLAGVDHIPTTVCRLIAETTLKLCICSLADECISSNEFLFPRKVNSMEGGSIQNNATLYHSINDSIVLNNIIIIAIRYINTGACTSQISFVYEV